MFEGKPPPPPGWDMMRRNGTRGICCMAEMPTKLLVSTTRCSCPERISHNKKTICSPVPAAVFISSKPDAKQAQNTFRVTEGTQHFTASQTRKPGNKTCLPNMRNMSGNTGVQTRSYNGCEWLFQKHHFLVTKNPSKFPQKAVH